MLLRSPLGGGAAFRGGHRPTSLVRLVVVIVRRRWRRPGFLGSRAGQSPPIPEDGGIFPRIHFDHDGSPRQRDTRWSGMLSFHHCRGFAAPLRRDSSNPGDKTRAEADGGASRPEQKPGRALEGTTTSFFERVHFPADHGRDEPKNGRRVRFEKYEKHVPLPVYWRIHKATNRPGRLPRFVCVIGPWGGAVLRGATPAVGTTLGGGQPPQPPRRTRFSG